MSTVSSAARSSHKRPHAASPKPNNQTDDPSSKRQKTPDSRGPALPADFFNASTTIPTVLPLSGRDRASLPPPKAVTDPTTTLGVTVDSPAASAAIDEDEWAAFEADIAETEATVPTIIPSASAIVISAAPTGPGGPLSTDDDDPRVTDAAFDREDAQNKLVEEFEEMESLESRVQKLKEQREALRAKAAETVGGRMDVTLNGVGDEVDEDDEEEDEDDWIHFSR